MPKEINVFLEGIAKDAYKIPEFTNWLHQILAKEHPIPSYCLNYIFCNDEYLLKVNQEYLQHDYYTDIITFPLEVSAENITSDLFISLDRVKDNAKRIGVSYEQETLRVIIHGLLHLIGFDDKEDELKLLMQKEEEKMLALYSY